MFPHASLPPERFLQAQPWFGRLSDDSRGRLAQAVFTVSARKASVVLRKNEQVQGWYAVLSGLVKLQSQSEKGRLSTFLGVPAGEWFGEGSALKHELRRYDVIALRDTELLCLPSCVFDELQADSLAFNQFLVAHLNRRLGQAMAVIEAGRIRSPEHRVAMYLSQLFWHGMRKLNLSQEELGHLVGLSRQTVNRVLNTLAHKQLVSLTAGRIAVLNDAALTQYLMKADTDSGKSELA